MAYVQIARLIQASVGVLNRHYLNMSTPDGKTRHVERIHVDRFHIALFFAIVQTPCALVTWDSDFFLQMMLNVLGCRLT